MITVIKWVIANIEFNVTPWNSDLDKRNMDVLTSKESIMNVEAKKSN